MQRVFTFILFLFISSTVFAENLCDPACSLVINFTNGGSIEAVEPVTFSFGVGGFVNDGAVTTGYADGDSLVIAAGESLVFTAGGAFDLGTDGNIDYSSMVITFSGGSLVLSSNGVISIHGNTTLAGGDIEINSTSAVNITGNVELGSGTTTTGSGELTIQAGGTLTLGNGSVLTEQSATISIDSVNALGGSLVITPTDQESLSLFAGTSFVTSDGNVCTVVDGECITSSGAKYVVVDGELVPADDGSSGSVDLVSILALLLLLPVLRNQAVFSMRKC